MFTWHARARVDVHRPRRRPEGGMISPFCFVARLGRVPALVVGDVTEHVQSNEKMSLTETKKKNVHFENSQNPKSHVPSCCWISPFRLCLLRYHRISIHNRLLRGTGFEAVYGIRSKSLCHFI